MFIIKGKSSGVETEITDIIGIGINSIQISVPEIDRLQCVICTVNEKNKVYTNCGHLVLCDSCAISYTLYANRRDAGGQLICQCPLCRTDSPSFANILYN